MTQATRRGIGHAKKNEPMEDAVLVTHCGPHTLLGIADGVGSKSSPHSREGAARALQVAAAHAIHQLPAYGPTEQLLWGVMAAVHVDITSYAKTRQHHPDAYASTLILALLDGERIVAARIGDGSLYTWDGRKLTRFCSANLPTNGTATITHPNWRQWVTTATHARDFTQGLVMCTDGADNLFLGPNRRGGRMAPSTDMIDFIAQSHVESGSEGGLFAALNILNDPAWLTQTQDDRTFIIAMRPRPPSRRADASSPEKATHARL